MRGQVFITAAVDHTDHNPSTTTSKDSLHDTAIILSPDGVIEHFSTHQHPLLYCSLSPLLNALKQYFTLPENIDNNHNFIFVCMVKGREFIVQNSLLKAVSFCITVVN